MGKYLAIFRNYDFSDLLEVGYNGSETFEYLEDYDGLKVIAEEFLTLMGTSFHMATDVPNVSDLLDALIDEKEWSFNVESV